MPLNQYPYTDCHELNADWIISKIKELEERVAALEEDNETEGGTENVIQ